MTVYEVVNEAVRELVLGVTERTMTGLIASHRFHRPGRLEDWHGELCYRSVEFALTPPEATEYLRRHAERRCREGWRVYCLS